MASNTIQLTGGSNRHAPRSDTRAWAGYVRRQAVYRSAFQGVPLESKPLPFSTSEGHRLPSTNNIVQDTTPNSTNTYQRVNYSGSFDLLPVKPKHSPQFKNIRPVIVRNEIIQSIEPATTGNLHLPTDLPNTVIANQFGISEEKHIPRRGKFNLRWPKLSVPKVMIGMAVVLFVGGAVISALSLRTNQEVKAQVKSVATTQTKQDDEGGLTAGIPDESGNPPPIASHKVPAANPRVIRIAKTNTEARILALGIAPTGELKAPANIFDAGWHKDSAKPGEAGAMLLDGHVSGPTKPGVFKKLGTLVSGDKIEIERGDGKKFIYTVTATKVFDADKLDMSSVMVSSVAGKPGLNIITCAGKYNKSTNKYEQRTVVYAVL